MFLTVFVMLLVGLSVASAANVTKTSDKVSKKSVDTSKAVKNFVVDKKVVKNTTKESIKTATSKTKTKVTISNVKKQYELKNQLQVKAKLTDNKNRALKNQYLTVKVNKNSFKVKTDKKGVATTKKISLNNVGKYTISANFAGTKKYASSKVTKTTKCTKMATKLVAENYLEYSKNQHENITFFLSNKKGKKINKKSSIDVIINNKNKKIKMEKGRIVLTLNNSKLNGVKLNNGTNNLTFKYTGDKTTKKVVKKFRFIINRTQPEIMMDVPKTINFGVIESFEPQILEPNYHHFKVIIDGKAYDARDAWYEDYWYEDIEPEYDPPIPVNYLPNKIGKHSIYVKFAGDYEYAPTKTDVSYFNVVRSPSVLSLDLKNKYNLNEELIIQSKLVYKNGQNITGENIIFSVNNQTFNRKTVDGIATLKYTPKKIGKYNISVDVKYYKNKNITKKNVNNTFKVGKNIIKKQTKIEVEYKKDILKNHNQTITVRLFHKPKQYNNTWTLLKNVNVDIKTDTFNKTFKTDSNGEINFSSADSNLYIYYVGNGSHLKSQTNVSVNIHKNATFTMKINYIHEYTYEDFDLFDYEVECRQVKENFSSLMAMIKSEDDDDYIGDSGWYLEIIFKNNYNLSLNKGNLDIYLDDVLFKSIKMNDSTIYTIYNFNSIVDKYFKYNTSSSCYVDRNNSNLIYAYDDEMEMALLSKFNNITYVYHNDGGVNKSISHSIREDNKISETTFVVVC